MQIIRSIQNRIYEIRGERILLDFDLADLYEVETKVLNQAVKRNISRFPEDFMFRLTTEEWNSIRSQIVTLNKKPLSQDQPHLITNLQSRSQNVTIETGRGQFTKYLPYAFTEQGVAMLSGVLRSEKAISMNIAITRAFVAVRKIIFQQNDIIDQVKQIRERMGEHDIQLSQLYDALENLMDEKAAERKWDQRERIGFKK